MTMEQLKDHPNHIQPENSIMTGSCITNLILPVKCLKPPCSGKEVLAGIKFKYDEDDDKMWWEFECAKVPYKLKCKQKVTSCKNNGHEETGAFYPKGNTYHVQYMDRHNLDCGDEGFMRGFKFENCVDKNSKGTRSVGGYLKYSGLKFRYSCCYVDK
jgi:hypothetical protein